MEKTGKRLITLLLTLSLLCALAVPAFAENRNEVINADETIFTSVAGLTQTLRGEDFGNGDACFFLIENQEIVYTAYVDRAAGEITTTDYTEASLAANAVTYSYPTQQ